MARNLDQVVQDISGGFVLQIARLTTVNEELSDKIKALEAEIAKLKAGKE